MELWISWAAWRSCRIDSSGLWDVRQCFSAALGEVAREDLAQPRVPYSWGREAKKALLEFTSVFLSRALSNPGTNQQCSGFSPPLRTPSLLRWEPPFFRAPSECASVLLPLRWAM